MKVFHIDQFKCTLCSNWYCPPFNLPYRLKCTHSICTNCLEKSIQNNSSEIICPEDMQKNKLSQISINQSTKKALQRLLRQHKNFTQTNHLECIKSLSISFDQQLDNKQIQLKNLSTLIDQIFQNQMKRLKEIYQKIKLQINKPFRVVKDWKEVVSNFLKKVKTSGPNVKGCVSQMNHYIEEGRKIKLDLNEYLKHDFRELIEHLLNHPQSCFTHTFSIFNQLQDQGEKERNNSLSKFQTLGKRRDFNDNFQSHNSRQLCLQDMTNNFDESSIRTNAKNQRLPHFSQGTNSVKMSLFEELIHETPKNGKSYNLQESRKRDEGKTPLNEMVFSSTQNVERNENAWDKSRVCGRFEDETGVGSEGYDRVIKEKISKMKQKGTQENKKMGSSLLRSLEYSPEYQSNGFQGYTAQDSIQTQSIAQHKSLSQFYSKQAPQAQQQQQNLLLQQKSTRKPPSQTPWQLQNFNFLKQWKINRHPTQQRQLQIIQRQGGYNCQKQKNRYAKKMQEIRIKEILKETTMTSNYISLVGQSLVDCNMTMFLNQIDWTSANIQIVKLIKTSMTDGQLNELLNFLVRSNVHTLMLSYNNLSELSLDALLNFVQLNDKLRNVYLPKNNISLLKGNARAKIALLKQKGINLYI